MTSTTNILLNQPTVGGDTGVWGPPLNANCDFLDQLLAQSVTVSFASASTDRTLTQAQMQYAMVTLTGTPSVSTVKLVLYQNMQGFKWIYNQTPNSVTIVTGNVGTTGCVVTPGTILQVRSDGTNVFPADTGQAIRIVTSGSPTLTAYDQILLINKSSGSATAVTLPSGGGDFIVKDGKGDAATNNITISVSGGGTIDGASSLVLNTAYASVRVTYNGTQYNATQLVRFPLTTNGDIFVQSGGLPARLGIGSNGQVLGVSSGALAWVTPSAGISGPWGSVVAKSVNYTVVAGDSLALFEGTNSITFSLTDCTTLGASSSAPFTVTIFNSGTGTIQITPLASKLINGTGLYTLAAKQWAFISTEGTHWDALGNGLGSSVTFDPSTKGTGVTLSNGNLTATGTTSPCSVRSTSSISGKVYFEFYVNTQLPNANYPGLGVCNSSANMNNYLEAQASGWTYDGNGSKYNNNVGTAFGAAFTTGDTIGVAVDTATSSIWFSKNGVWQASGDPAAGTSPAFNTLSGTIFAAASFAASGSVVTARFASTSFAYAAPSGFSALS